MVTTRPLPSLLSILRVPRTLGLGHRSVHIWNCCGEVMASFLGYYKGGYKNKTKCKPGNTAKD